MKRGIPVLLFFLLCGGAASAQNVLFLQCEGNLLPPDGGPSWVGGSIGTNLLLYKTLVQTDIAVFVGGITVVDESGVKENKVLVKVSDALFASYPLIPALSLRGGLSAGIGIYSGGLINGLMNVALLLGVHILPESRFSFTLDVQGGYAFAFYYDTANSDFLGAFSMGTHGLAFPITLGLRLNLDRL